ncbi:hypothetical protein CPU12_03865 [Malaciobacter molluscorum LMG 25693]|uniref:DUF89 domain-containing protein n=1 Tax=Malaciobacter molluscorum LMG 25693 TaxID=870501 RepID=A0A2G1DJU2_9BACT|nr:ARMT1-like domain-containing protein [Malaciobacter molluscorum]AXX92875.1 DUF89 domain-containing protein [Malaciobacter molluscorum LMG 25693]PHO18710.1 hypothetical protein CPU12_03865 [Malaciobacter molluscorum LMG 25693]
MNITNTCVECIKAQIYKATKLLKIDDSLANEINEEVIRKSSNFDFSKTPPYVAKEVYELLAKKINMNDPLEDLKQKSIKNAISYLPIIKEEIKNAKDKLFTSLKASVAGNVIDFAITREFSLEEEIKNIFHTDFAINDYKSFKQKLENSNQLLILSDNAGENVFDKELIKTIKSLYPYIKIIYATRGKPIINDITTKEALQINMQKYCEVISSGVDTPGIEKSQASKEFINIFDNSPLILSKGMGNFECLEAYQDDRIFFLFKVKCDVVASKIKRQVGEIVLKRG